MNDQVSRKALIDTERLLDWLLDLHDGTGDRAEKYAYGRVEQEIESGRFNIPSTESEGKVELMVENDRLLGVIEKIEWDSAVRQRNELMVQVESQKAEIEDLRAACIAIVEAHNRRGAALTAACGDNDAVVKARLGLSPANKGENRHE